MANIAVARIKREFKEVIKSEEVTRPTWIFKGTYLLVLSCEASDLLCRC